MRAKPTIRTALLAVLAFATPQLAFSQSDSARYELTFVATWSARTHPDGFPPGAHFSPLIGATHSAGLSLWSAGTLASTGIERMAELGSTQPLSDEIATAIAAGTASSLVQGSGIGSSPGQEAVELTVTRDHPLISVVSMIAPSPDWFVGIAGSSLLEDGAWVDLRVVELFAYDAGTDSGSSYSATDLDTDPAQPIQRIDGAPFLGVALGQLIFRRIDGAALPTLELRNGRFEVRAAWSSPQGSRGIGQPASITDDTGYFWFFQESNTEVLVKVLLGCFLNNRYWVFAGGLTNLEVHLVIEDTESGELRGYLNSAGQPFRPIQDTAAFTACP